jgi:hypothetical protein
MLSSAVENLGVGLAKRTSRRSALGLLGRGFLALVGGPFVAVALDPSRAGAFRLCGVHSHIGSCPHPFSPRTRIDQYGYAVHPDYGYPIDDKGKLYRSRKQKRTKICAGWVPREYPSTGSPELQGSWTRCCGGRIRRIWDCCSYSNTRINGDAAFPGYCYGDRNVFCVTYVELHSRC